MRKDSRKTVLFLPAIFSTLLSKKRGASIMSQSLFRGSGVALVTPMTPDGHRLPRPRAADRMAYRLRHRCARPLRDDRRGRDADLCRTRRDHRAVRPAGKRPRPCHRRHRLEQHRLRHRTLTRGLCSGRGRRSGRHALLQQGDAARARASLHCRRRRRRPPAHRLQCPLPHRRELHRRDLRRARAAPEHRRRQGGLRQLCPDPGDP